MEKEKGKNIIYNYISEHDDVSLENYDGEEFVLFQNSEDYDELNKILYDTLKKDNEFIRPYIDVDDFISCGYSDEYMNCYECFNLVHLADSDTYQIMQYGCYCEKCIRESMQDEYFEELINHYDNDFENHTHINEIFSSNELIENGFSLRLTDLENGMYGKIDNPLEILRKLDNSDNHKKEYLFHLTSKNPFAIYFEVYDRERAE